MSDELDSLAAAGADVLVRAIASDGWEAAKGLYARILRGREHQVQRTREALDQGEGGGHAATYNREKAGWRTRLRDEMDADESFADEIRRVLAAQPAVSAGDVSQTSSGAVGAVQQAAASGASSVTQVAAPGGRNIRVNSPDQRRYKFSVPLVPLFLRNVIAKHTVASVIVLVAVGGVTTGVVTAAHSSGHSGTPAICGSYTTVAVPPDTSLTSPAFAPSGTMLAALEIRPDGGEHFTLVNLAQSDALESIDTTYDPLNGSEQEFSFDPVGGLLAYVGTDAQSVVLLNTSNWSVVRTITNPDSQVTQVEYSPSGSQLVTSSGSDLYFYRTSDYLLVQTMSLHGAPAGAAFAISPDGTTAATGGFVDATVALWNTATGQQIGTFTPAGGDTSVASLSFSPDGKYIAVLRLANPANEVDIWSLGAKRVVGSWELPTQFTDTSMVQFSPDGKTLMATSGPGIDLCAVNGF